MAFSFRSRRRPTRCLRSRPNQGRFKIRLSDLAGGAIHRDLGGRVEAQRVPASVPLVETPTEDDFPAAAGDERGNVWVAYVCAHAPRSRSLRGVHCRSQLVPPVHPFGRRRPGAPGSLREGRAGKPLPITAEGLEVVRPAVAIDGQGKVVIAWAENRGGNFEIMFRIDDPETSALGEVKALSKQPGTDTDVVLAPAPDGRVWAAWQGFREGQAEIWLAPVDGSAPPVNVSESPANEWSPALAVSRDGSLHVAYDSYMAGNYDVMLRTRGPDGALEKARRRRRLAPVRGSAQPGCRPHRPRLGGIRGADGKLGEGRPEPHRGARIKPLSRGPQCAFGAWRERPSARLPTRWPAPRSRSRGRTAFRGSRATARAGSGSFTAISRRQSGATMR